MVTIVWQYYVGQTVSIARKAICSCSATGGYLVETCRKWPRMCTTTGSEAPPTPQAHIWELCAVRTRALADVGTLNMPDEGIRFTKIRVGRRPNPTLSSSQPYIYNPNPHADVFFFRFFFFHVVRNAQSVSWASSACGYFWIRSTANPEIYLQETHSTAAKPTINPR